MDLRKRLFEASGSLHAWLRRNTSLNNPASPDTWDIIPDAMTLRMKYKRWERRLTGVLSKLPGAVAGAVKGVIESEVSCRHVGIKVVNAEVVKTIYGYSYWVAHLRCLDCPEEWKVQARTPGRYSAEPQSNVFRS